MITNLIVFSILFFISFGSFADSLKSDQELRKFPKIKSEVIGKVSKGEVEVIDKKGFWIKVKKDSVEGWTKLNNVEIDKDSNFSLSCKCNAGGTFRHHANKKTNSRGGL